MCVGCGEICEKKNAQLKEQVRMIGISSYGQYTHTVEETVIGIVHNTMIGARLITTLWNLKRGECLERIS